jgi:hypothetical protein
MRHILSLNRFRFLAVALTAVLVAPGQARADNTPLVIVDEHGFGTFQFPGAGPIPFPGVLAPDHGPGGLPMAFTYFLPFNTVVAGDVTLVKPGPAAVVSDVIRFNPETASLVFYSDVDADHSGVPADTGFPTAFYTNHIVRTDDASLYTPNDAQPGFAPGFSVTYKFLSETSPVPAPPAVVLAGLGAGCVAWRRYVGRRTTA